MQASNQLSSTTILEDKVHAGCTSSPALGGSVLALSQPLPFSAKTRNGLSLVLFLAAISVAWQSLGSLLSLSQQQEQFSHIVLIPFLSLYVLYLERSVIFSSRDWSPWLGALLILSGSWIYWSAPATNLAQDELSMTIFGFVAICWGIFVLSFGTTVCKRVSFGLLCLLFMVPIPSILLDAIVRFLQQASTETAAVLFSVLDIPVFRQGFVFSLSNFTIHVAEECSGIRSALSLFITSLVAGHFFLRSFTAKMGLVAVVIPLAIVKNAFRIVGLALLANYVDPAFITNSPLHRSGGIPLFVISLILLLGLTWLLRRLEKRWTPSIQNDRIGS
jgi:exosortase